MPYGRAGPTRGDGPCAGDGAAARCHPFDRRASIEDGQPGITVGREDLRAVSSWTAPTAPEVFAMFKRPSEAAGGPAPTRSCRRRGVQHSGPGRAGGSGSPRDRHHGHSWGSFVALAWRGGGRAKPALYSSCSTRIDPPFPPGGVIDRAVPASARRRFTRIRAARTGLATLAATRRTRRRTADHEPRSDKSPQGPFPCPFTKSVTPRSHGTEIDG